MSKTVLVANHVGHTFHSSGKSISPFDNLSFEIEASRILAVRGASGSGKTTLLLACGGMRAPSAGKVLLQNQDIYELPHQARIGLRSATVGYLFQTLELIPYLTVLDNVLLAGGATEDRAKSRLSRLGLGERLNHKPNELSHGERQRVALARSLAHEPVLIICDEPTGNLDEENSQMVFEALKEFANEGGAVLIASHDPKVDSFANEALWLGKAEPTSNQENKFEEGSRPSSPETTSRVGTAHYLMVFLLSSLILLIGLGWAALRLRPDAARERDTATAESVRIYCAAGVAKPVEAVVAKFNAEYGENIEVVRTGGSGELAGQIKTEFETGLAGAADLCLSADENLMEEFHKQGVIAERFVIAEQRPVIAVNSNFKGDLASLKDLVARDDLKFGVASKRAAVGKIVREIASREGVLEQLEIRKTTDAENVMTLAQALATGSLDAAVIWDTTVNQVNQANQKNDDAILKITALVDSTNQLKSSIVMGVLSSSNKPTRALKFCRFLSGANASQETFERFGFNFIQGDLWEEVPEVHLYCGSMFTPVLEESVREFSNREGVNIYPRWQGCGKLVASIEGTSDPALFPDAFLACDVSFLNQVQGHFQPYSLISSNDIVMVVRKDFELELSSPRDLLKPEVRFGICDPQLSALGSLTRRLLNNPPYSQLYDQVHDDANVIVDVGPTLISQVLADGLDAAIVYRSNVMADEKAETLLKLVELKSALATARQPWAVSKNTQNSQLMNRMHEWISREQIRNRFSRFGFRDSEERTTLNRP